MAVSRCALLGIGGVCFVVVVACFLGFFFRGGGGVVQTGMDV